MSLPLAEIVLAIAAINLATFALFGLDKALARREARRRWKFISGVAATDSP